MKKFFEIGNFYMKNGNWKDLALMKFCLFSMGILIGLWIPQSIKKPIGFLALGVFLVTYGILMMGLYLRLKNRPKEQ